jgi:putative DNA methylase
MPMPGSARAARKPRPDGRAQPELALTPAPALVELGLKGASGPRAIEDEAFPFEALSDIAEIESWRKEISRPLSHVHKWWAQRLGTVFRAVVLGTFAPAGRDLLELFYARARVTDAVVFDPFMGSGTTIVEALKLGARAIGRDINPVACFAARNALAQHDRQAVLDTFGAIERDVAAELRRYYLAELEDGTTAEVLYFFWVKVVPCPQCANGVDLFGSYIFAHHAYPKKYAEAQALCPHCGEVNATRYDAGDIQCAGCRRTFNAMAGPARGTKARCGCCGHEFPIAKTVKAGGRPPDHRLYAKLTLLPDGRKVYLRATAADQKLYAAAEQKLAARPNAFPVVAIAPGYNTDQALGYNYRHWHEMFNARQLLGLSILGERIARIGQPALRELFLCLLSGTLEFNNMFASYKGEGTGAVRHMFYHHILKPERVPLEANLWGTPKSSGSFSTLFESRILRALDYAGDPFELRLAERNGKASSTKVFGLSEPIGHATAADFASFAAGTKLYLSCGDSSRTDLAAGSVDAVISDPPFFDNVHYSQLADFFHVWQRHFAGDEFATATTRAPGEVQNSDATAFTERLGAVWRECCRVLKDDGLLVFTYHHSRSEGWASILQALMDAGFAIAAAHPIKSEMSVATPKHQAKEPIDLDIILVCRKRDQSGGDPEGDLWGEVKTVAQHQVSRLRASGRWLSRNDLKIIVMAQLVRRLSRSQTSAKALAVLEREGEAADRAIGDFNGEG